MSNKQFFNNLSSTYADVRRLDAKVVDAKKIKFNGENIENLWGLNLPKDYPKLISRCELAEDDNYILYDDFGNMLYISFADRLINGQGLFYESIAFNEWNYDLPNLKNGFEMFFRSSIKSFNGDLSNLINGGMMFSEASIKSFNGNLSSLESGYYMFDYCTQLEFFNSNLSNLKDGMGMFNNCKLNAASVENILVSIPTHTDGELHQLTLSLQNDEAMSKFIEITGASSGSIETNYKGWTISANISEL